MSSICFTPRRATAGAAALLVTLAALACGGGDRKSSDTSTPSNASNTPPAESGSGGTTTASAQGEQLYQRCATCHQANGQGVPGNYPPLAGSEWVNATPGVPIRVVLHGLQGSITVKGQQYSSAMPPYGTGQEMSDAEVAAVVSYIRTSWGNSAGPVTAEQVAAVRKETAAHTGMMTEADLKAAMQATP